MATLLVIVVSGLIAWYAFAYLVRDLARAKNRSGTTWFFLSLLLGPIAFLILIILKRKAWEEKIRNGLY